MSIIRCSRKGTSREKSIGDDIEEQIRDLDSAEISW